VRLLVVAPLLLALLVPDPRPSAELKFDPTGGSRSSSAQQSPATDRTRRLFPPEELGTLEGPDRDSWQKPDQVMDALRIGEGSVVTDLGAGGGWFTVRLARRVGPNGIVFAQDVQPQMLDSIRRRVDREGFRNVRYVRGEPTDPKLRADTPLDAVLIVDAYHEFSDPISLLRGLRAAIKPSGRIGIVNFTMDGGGPGPPASERVPAERVIEQAAAAGLTLVTRETFLEFQYFLIFGKEEATPPVDSQDTRAHIPPPPAPAR
jgi:ubiquinone/menaquinone biosynthesis C-methylase UbiE